MTEVTDIEPYADNDVPEVISRLIKDSDFIDALGQLRFKAWYRALRPLLKPRVRSFLKSKASSVKTVRDFQLALEPHLAKILSSTTKNFTVSGLDHLDPNQSYLFLSNHRDIAMDPTFVNWALHSSGFDTTRIAIGDNLIKKSFIGDLMRLNKSFIVKRNISGPREMLQTYSELSGYIRQSIDDGHSIWIAQREGRAKDGIDRTDPAILKMLAIAGKSRQENFLDAVDAVKLVPVSISYEFDPCAPMKARELSITERDGEYKKRPDEDEKSIVAGIMGWKGQVHLHFGEQITEMPETPQELAARIDRKIILGQRVFDTGRLADAMLTKAKAPDDLSVEVKERFQALILATPDKYRSKLLEIYANPLRQFALHQDDETH